MSILLISPETSTLPFGGIAPICFTETEPFFISILSFSIRNKTCGFECILYHILTSSSKIPSPIQDSRKRPHLPKLLSLPLPLTFGGIARDRNHWFFEIFKTLISHHMRGDLTGENSNESLIVLKLRRSNNQVQMVTNNCFLIDSNQINFWKPINDSFNGLLVPRLKKRIFPRRPRGSQNKMQGLFRVERAFAFSLSDEKHSAKEPEIFFEKLNLFWFFHSFDGLQMTGAIPRRPIWKTGPWLGSGFGRVRGDPLQFNFLEGLRVNWVQGRSPLGNGGYEYAESLIWKNFSWWFTRSL